MSEELDRVAAALQRIDLAAKSEGIEEGHYLGSIHLAYRELAETLFLVQGEYAEKMRGVVDAAQSVVRTASETTQREVEALRIERGKIDRHLAKAEVDLGALFAKVAENMGDLVAARVGDATVIRARTWKRVELWRLAAGMVGVALLVLVLGICLGESWGSNGAPADFLTQCVQTLHQDPVTHKAFCAVEVSRP